MSVLTEEILFISNFNDANSHINENQCLCFLGNSIRSTLYKLLNKEITIAARILSKSYNCYKCRNMYFDRFLIKFDNYKIRNSKSVVLYFFNYKVLQILLQEYNCLITSFDIGFFTKFISLIQYMYNYINKMYDTKTSYRWITCCCNDNCIDLINRETEINDLAIVNRNVSRFFHKVSLCKSNQELALFISVCNVCSDCKDRYFDYFNDKLVFLSTHIISRFFNYKLWNRLKNTKQIINDIKNYPKLNNHLFVMQNHVGILRFFDNIIYILFRYGTLDQLQKCVDGIKNFIFINTNQKNVDKVHMINENFIYLLRDNNVVVKSFSEKLDVLLDYYRIYNTAKELFFIEKFLKSIRNRDYKAKTRIFHEI